MIILPGQALRQVTPVRACPAFRLVLAEAGRFGQHRRLERTGRHLALEREQRVVGHLTQGQPLPDLQASDEAARPLGH